jgi:hypothetical protein
MRPLVRSALLVTACAMAACEPDRSPTAPADPAAAQLSLHGGNPAFSPGTDPLGISMVVWSERWWRWELSVPSDVNPALDPTGDNCAQGQGPLVFKLASTFAPGTVNRHCTIAYSRPILVALSTALNDYPCPDPTFQPAPGQSLFDFLAPGAAAVENGVNSLTLTVDGQAVPGLFSYRVATPLFLFQGDPTLTATIDGCITGHPQPAVSDGYFVMLKPLGRGTHTVNFGAAAASGFSSTVNYTLTISRD